MQRIAERIGRSLERSGLITRDIENAYLAFDPGEEAPINALLGASITYRIATGPREGQKVFTLQTQPAEPEAPRREVAESSGFSLHADRARVVPRTRAAVAGECGEASVTDRQRALTWAQRLKRVFAIEIETCRRCGGRLRVIASIEAPTTIERILVHLGRDAEPVDPAYPSRAPPQGEFSF